MEYSKVGDDDSSHVDDLVLSELNEEDDFNDSVSNNKAARGSSDPSLRQPLFNNGNSGSNDLEAQNTAGGSDDPFYVFREDLYKKLELVDEGLTSYLRVVNQTDASVNTYELKEKKKQLKRYIKNAEGTLKDVQTTISIVEESRDKFTNISSSELYDRKSLLQTSIDRINSVKSDMNSQRVKNKLLSDEKAKAIRRIHQQQGNNDIENNNNSSNNGLNNSNNNNTYTNSTGNSDTDDVANSQAKQSLMLQQQDETLDELDEAVTRVGEYAKSINTEILDQNKLLGELDEDLDDVEEKLGMVMGKLGKMLKTSSKCEIGTVLTLSFIVIILFFLVLYT